MTFASPNAYYKMFPWKEWLKDENYQGSSYDLTVADLLPDTQKKVKKALQDFLDEAERTGERYCGV